jgi:hypothetical protein
VHVWKETGKESSLGSHRAGGIGETSRPQVNARSSTFLSAI